MEGRRGKDAGLTIVQSEGEDGFAHDGGLLGATFLTLLESMPDGILLVDTVGNIAVSNAEAARLFGYVPHELRGLSVEQLLPTRFRTRHRQYRADYLQHPRNRPMGEGFDLHGLRKDGSEF